MYCGGIKMEIEKMKKTRGISLLIIFVFLIFSYIAFAQSDKVSVAISNKNIIMQAGRNVAIPVKITNNQEFQDTFEIFISGSYPYQIRYDKNVTIQPNSYRNINILISSPPNAFGTFNIVISAVSKKNSNIWNQDKASISILSLSKLSSFHDQPPLLSLGPIGPGHIGINFYSNPRIIDRGYVISNGEECCVGSELVLDGFSLLGEWYPKGGPQDSPPVTWVRDLEEIKRKINSFEYNVETHEAYICSWMAVQEAATGPERCIVSGSLVCSANCELNSDAKISGSLTQTFKVLEPGEIKLSYSCPVDCIFFVNRKNKTYYGARAGEEFPKLKDVYGYMELGKALPIVNSTLTVKAVSGELGPDISIVKSTITSTVLKENEKTFIRMILKNSGDMVAKIDNISLNLNNYITLFQPKELLPGEEKEIIIKARAQDVGTIRADIEYRSDKLGCLPTKEFKESFSIASIKITGKLEKCSSDRDCKYGETCCEGYCMDLTHGFCDDINGDGIPETWTEYW